MRQKQKRRGNKDPNMQRGMKGRKKEGKEMKGGRKEGNKEA